MLSLCMIVKDEEQFLEAALKSAQKYVDDIVVVDTGSTDATKRIAADNGARVFDFNWVGNFSAARNYAAGLAEHDWIFVLDADETVIAFDREYVHEFISGSGHVGSVVRYEVADETAVVTATRLYNRRHFHYHGTIHEQVVPSVASFSYDIADIPVELNHYGYMPDVMSSKRKLERNEEMLEKELVADPLNPYLLYQLGKANFAMARNLNKACDYFEKALAQKPSFRLEYVLNLVVCYGYALLRSNQFEKSMRILDYGKFYRNNPNFEFLCAHIYVNNGMFIEAVERFEACLNLGKKRRTGIGSYLSYFNIAVILETLGMADDAKNYYEKCGEYEPALARLKNLQTT